MQYRILGGLTAALLGALVEAPPSGYAQSQDLSGLSRPTSLPFQPFPPDSSADPETSAPPRTETSNSNHLNNWISPSERIITLFPHRLDQRRAVTLYIRAIPLMTFLGSELPLSEGAKPPIVGDFMVNDPALVERAIAVATRLEEFCQLPGEATEIGVRWSGESEKFLISLAENSLITVDETTIFPNPTQDTATDALQITNRLRYLLGEAPPLEKVEGLPQPAPPEPPPEPTPRVAAVFTGVASWYGPGFHGRRSASGEVFNQHAMTAAHRSLPFGTQVRVTNLNTGHQIVVRINDRGPFIPGRVIDLSAGAAAALNMTYSGLTQVRLEVLSNQ